MAVKTTRRASAKSAPQVPEPAPLPEGRLIPISKWPHTWPSANGLKAMAFRRKTNGLDAAFIKASPKKLLVDEARFFALVRQNAKNRGKD